MCLTIQFARDLYVQKKLIPLLVVSRLLMREPVTFLLVVFLSVLSIALAYVWNIVVPDHLRWLNIEKDFVRIETLFSSIVGFLS